MKLRVKYGDQKSIIEINDSNATVKQLKKELSVKFSINYPCIKLSLNGRDILETSNDQTANLKELGIVSGDTIYVIKNISHIGEVDSGGFIDQVNGKKHENDVIMMEDDLKLNNATSKDVEKGSDKLFNMLFQPNDDNKTFATQQQQQLQYQLQQPQQQQQQQNSIKSPSLLKDSTENNLPKVLTEMLVEFSTSGKKRNKNISTIKAIVALLHTLLCEKGFQRIESQKPMDITADDDDDEAASATTTTTTTTAAAAAAADDDDDDDDYDMVEMEYRHHQLDHNTTFQLMVVSIMNRIKCHLIVRRKHEDGSTSIHKESMNINANDYVNTSRTDMTKLYRVDKLPQLCRIFHQSVVHHILQYTFQEQGYRALADLNTLPMLVKLKLLSYLRVQDLLNLAQLNRQWRDDVINNADDVWRRMYRGHFKDEPHDVSNWFERFKESYVRKRREEEEREERRKRQLEESRKHFHPPKLFPYDNNFFNQGGRYVGENNRMRGMIGGAYDLYPGGAIDPLADPRNQFSFRGPTQPRHLPPLFPTLGSDADDDFLNQPNLRNPFGGRGGPGLGGGGIGGGGFGSPRFL